MKHAALAIIATVALGTIAPAFAADEMKGGAMADCKSMSSSMMMMHDKTAMKGDAMKGDAMNKMTGDADHDSAMMMADLHKKMLMTAKFEAQCGKSDKQKADAAALAKALEDLVTKYPAAMHVQ